MLQKFMNTLFGCSHQRTTFPLTQGRKNNGFAVPGAARTYIVCLDCGREFDYNWSEMRVGEAVTPLAPAAQAQPMYR